MPSWKYKTYGYINNKSHSENLSETSSGIPFKDLPDTWKYPVCGAGKDEFEEIDDTDVHASVISINGQIESRYSGQEGIQEINQDAFFRPVSVYNNTIYDRNKTVLLLTRALK